MHKAHGILHLKNEIMSAIAVAIAQNRIMSLIHWQHFSVWLHTDG